MAIRSKSWRFYSFLVSRRLALILLTLLVGVAGVEVALGLQGRGLNVYGSGWFLSLGLLLLINLLACTLQRLGRWMKVGRASPSDRETYLEKRVERVEVAEEAEGGGPIAGVERVERAEASERSGRPAISRQRWLSREEAVLLGSLLFHLGLAAVLMGALYDQLTLWRGSLFLTEGQTLSLEGSGRAGPRAAASYTGEEGRRPWQLVRRGPWGRPDLVGVSLRLEDLHLAYYPDGSLRELRADLAFRDARAWWRGEVPAVLRVNYPLYWRGVKFILRNYGFAPRFTLRELSAFGPRSVFDGYVNLDFYAHGPGSEDGFRAGDGLVVRARFYPDWRGEQGKPLSSTTELRNPRFWLRVEGAETRGFNNSAQAGDGGERGDGFSLLYAGWVRPGEAVHFARPGVSYELLIPELRYWVQLEASTEEGLPAVVAGLWLAVGGLALRYGAEFFAGAAPVKV